MNSVAKNVSTLQYPQTLVLWNIKSQFTQSGRYAVVVHGTNKALVIAYCQLSKEPEHICRVSWSFRTKPPTSARNEQLLPVVERIINVVLTKKVPPQNK